ncbi:MAG: 3-deoxy-manno-octulosonate cytidylyltransferase [Bacteroidota bacterium]|nr:3-deoxy-manno-octulosonate cytidylyltransferase [Bacteroidota bacterium]
MKILGVIPARYASTRFPGKPLAMIGDKTMIRRVYERSHQCPDLSELVVATDDHRIEEHVLAFGGKALMTSPNHRSGTERCREVLDTLGGVKSFDVVINIQGDEPYIRTEQISLLTGLFNDTNVKIGTLIKKISGEEELFNHNVVKVIFDRNQKAICFSRQPLPFYRGKPENEWIKMHDYFKHIGIYGYRSSVLTEITKLEVSPLEKAESLEQLRWIENGFSIYVRRTNWESVAIDTPDDLLKLTNTD